MVTIYFIWIIPIRLKRKRYPIQIRKIPNILSDWTPKSGSCTPLVPNYMLLEMSLVCKLGSRAAGNTAVYREQIDK